MGLFDFLKKKEDNQRKFTKEEVDELILLSLNVLCDHVSTVKDVEKFLKEKGLDDRQTSLIASRAIELYQTHFANKKEVPQNNQLIDDNLLLLDILKNRLITSGYQVENHPQYMALIINSALEIATAINDNPDNHPSIIQLTVLTLHSKYFPNGIEENIVGIGSTIQDKIDSVLDNYLTTTFEPIIDSFTDSHNPALDFSTVIDNKEILWHPKLGNLSLQGQWELIPENEAIFELLKEKVKYKLTTQKLNWLKVYISKRGDGRIIGECLFNNEPWQEGLDIISNYAKTWTEKGDFFGQKQFIMFRRCDACDQ
ncbi:MULTISPECIES: DUF6348 family protein [unclassified Arcicella]|uniref:DUF6348 family protein n=1 Tax=unclassified Arcicella TaxID=2644986 RepID=UPI0028589A50|nr:MULTISPECIES: DUF6348 family protein [unclassified Arcicella]MDR6560082.1 hypothetical protein [Arcicella sp. BE51]MDR6810311.1 hypothetical protein [Arcicella sp. BE140]MDR6821661.1 hypothetical protein [Arcicella sp. BE139]